MSNTHDDAPRRAQPGDITSIEAVPGQIGGTVHQASRLLWHGAPNAAMDKAWLARHDEDLAREAATRVRVGLVKLGPTDWYDLGTGIAYQDAGDYLSVYGAGGREIITYVGEARAALIAHLDRLSGAAGGGR